MYFWKMGKHKFLFLFLLVFMYACGNSSSSKRTKEEIMQKGALLYSTHGCNVCHSLDGSIVYGPPLNDIYLKDITVVRNGKEYTLKADRKYLKKAISDPRHEKNKEYRNKEMPITSFTKEEAELLVEYLILLNSGQKINN